MKHMLPDEACHISDEHRVYSLSESLQGHSSHEVMLHNTMRFDVALAHIRVMLEDGDVTTDYIADVIADAIIDAVHRAVGEGLDGIDIPSPIVRVATQNSVMLHRETIHVDLS